MVESKDTREPDPTELRDECLIKRILSGQTELYEIIIRRYNLRLYRVIKAILHNGAETEDVIQETHVRAYEHLHQFAGRALFSTWLTRIAVHEAWHRANQQSRRCDVGSTAASFGKCFRVPQEADRDVLAHETRTILEQAIDGLPQSLRPVFVMRSLENMTTAETSKCLGISEAAVKVRLLRARHMLRRVLRERAHTATSDAFRFLGEQCDRVTYKVLSRIAHV